MTPKPPDPKVRRKWRPLAFPALAALLAIAVLLWAFAPRLLQSGEISCPDFEPAGSDLVVLLHAFDKTSQDLEKLRGVVEEALRDPDVLACDLPFDTLSMAHPEEVVHGLMKAIDDAWDKKERSGGAYDRVIFVGHSMGGLFARKAYVVASGETAEAPFEPELKALLAPGDTDSPLASRGWAPAVDRIVLMAGMNRGWSISHHMSIGRAVAMSAGVALGRLLEWRFDRLPLIFSVRRGAPFVTNLRIQWLEMRRHARETPAGETPAPGGATTVQLLGSVDDLVSPEDNIDLVSGRDFFYLDVPFTGHSSIIDMELPPRGGPPAATREEQARHGRAEKFRLALTGTREELDAEQVLSVDLGQAHPRCRPTAAGPVAAAAEPPDPTPGEEGKVVESAAPPAAAEAPETHVVFVIHGIRDTGYWTQKIARRIQARVRGTNKTVVPETSTYGYFPMLPFLSSRARREKVEWMMDRYTEARACYPDAKFHYVGHSNGTYMLAKALKEYPSCRFNRVVFAGSVVRTDYGWGDVIQRGQVEAVLNFVASRDWVVAFFPKALELVDWKDLGSAGHDGFQEAVFQPATKDGEPRFVEGHHSAALDEALWDSIARFVIEDELPEDFATRLTADTSLKGLFVADRGPVVSLLGSVAWLLWIGIVIVLIAIVRWLVRRPVREAWRTLLVLGFLALVWLVVTRI